LESTKDDRKDRKKRKRKRRSKREWKRVLLEVYVDPECLPRFDRIARAFEKKLPAGAALTRGDGARAAINVGLDTIERDLGITWESKEPTAEEPKPN
jgi:hypothetical protein